MGAILAKENLPSPGRPVTKGLDSLFQTILGESNPGKKKPFLGGIKKWFS
jgi:hypothetical protein